METSETPLDPPLLMEVTVTNLPASAEKLDEYRKAQTVDKVCSTVTHYCHNGWPQKKNDLTVDLVPYCKARQNLTVDKNNLLLYGKRIVFPKPLRRETLEKSTWVIKESKDVDSVQTSQCGGLEFPRNWRTWSGNALHVHETFHLTNNL